MQVQAQTTLKTADLNAMTQAAKIHDDRRARQMDHEFEMARAVMDHQHEGTADTRKHALDVALTAMEHRHNTSMQQQQLTAQKEQAQAQAKARPASKPAKPKGE